MYVTYFRIIYFPCLSFYLTGLQFAVLRISTRSRHLKYLNLCREVKSQNPCLSMFLVLVNIPSMEIPPTVVLKKVVAETEIQIQFRILRCTIFQLRKSTSYFQLPTIPPFGSGVIQSVSIFFLMNSE